MFTATASATYSATTSGTASGTGNTELEALNAANNAALTATQDAIATIQNTIVSSTSLLLLEKTNTFDITVSETFNYYWDKYPDLFGKIQIIYTDVDENGNIITDNTKIIENNIKYLNEYYNKGYRVFIGFSRSTILAGVLPWFENVGTKAKGISLNSSSSSLDFPKPVYRLQIDDNKIIDSLNFILTNASKIYYIYGEGEVATINVLNYLELLYPGRIIPFPVKPDSSNLTLENIKNLYKDVDDKSVSIMYMFANTQQKDFVNLFNDSYPMPTTTFDIVLSNYPKINETSKNALINKFNYLVNVSFSTAELFREGLESLKELFSTYVPNALLLINNLAVNQGVTSLPADNSILQFNENNDIKYFTFLNTIYSKTDKGEYYYKQEFYSIYDPIVDRQLFYVNPPLSTF